jgi:predicted acyltransferase
MIEASPWFRFLVSALAAWRLSHLLAAEDGPWDVIVRVRRMLGTTIWGRLMDCFECLSIWISLPLALYVIEGWLDRLVVWLSLSGAACLAERLNKPPLFFENMDRPK